MVELGSLSSCETPCCTLLARPRVPLHHLSHKCSSKPLSSDRQPSVSPYIPLTSSICNTYALMVHESSDLIDLYTLHWKLGHLSPGIIRTLMNANAITGYQLIDDLSPFSCDACAHAKMRSEEHT